MACLVLHEGVVAALFSRVHHVGSAVGFRNGILASVHAGILVVLAALSVMATVVGWECSIFFGAITHGVFSLFATVEKIHMLGDLLVMRTTATATTVALPLIFHVEEILLGELCSGRRCVCLMASE